MSDKEKDFLPVVPLRGIVLFPGMTLHFDIGRKQSLAALKAAGETGGEMLFVAQKSIMDESPTAEELGLTGVVGNVRQIVKLPDSGGTLRVIVEGRRRARIAQTAQQFPYIKAQTEFLEDDYTMPEGFEGSAQVLTEASLYSARRYFDEYCEHVPQITPDIVGSFYEEKNPSAAADIIAGNVILSVDDKQELLDELNVYSRLSKICVKLANEIEILTVDELLQEKVQEQMDKNQREYYLREELKAVTEELGDIDGDDISAFRNEVSERDIPKESKEKLFTELDRLKRLSSSSPDANVLRTYIEKCLEIPWGVYTKENADIEKAVKILNRDHYGLKDVKERITEMLAARIVSPSLKGQIICLAGPPGVGKTSVAKSIAAATGRNYMRISLGGIKDEAEIRGHRRTYIGAIPGRIITAVSQAKSLNPLILLDEIDKLGGDFKGDPASALLEALDAEQNFSFRDHYIELPVDLSRVLFITTANDKNAIPDALRDRMEIIDLSSYTYEEKFNIAKKHLIPKQLKEHSLKKSQLHLSDAAIRLIVDGYTREAGVRALERQIAKLCRKEAMRLASGNTEKLNITDKNLEEYLGVKKYRPDEKKREDTTGLVNGLAWTSVGGELLEVEAAVLEGSGKLELTGSLGDVMKESAHAAVSYIRSRASALGIDGEFYKTKDIHLHFPEGAVPKDGPSAGVSITTALVSALSGCKVRADVAMTGEITLRGRVLAIGGLREKSMAAYRENMKYVIIPQANVPDLEEVDDAVKEKITFVPVEIADEVLKLSLVEKEPVVLSEAEKKKDASRLRLPLTEYKDKRGRTGELQ